MKLRMRMLVGMLLVCPLELGLRFPYQQYTSTLPWLTVFDTVFCYCQEHGDEKNQLNLPVDVYVGE